MGIFFRHSAGFVMRICFMILYRKREANTVIRQYRASAQETCS